MNPKTAGYSGTPLIQKLGIKPGFRVKTRNAPRAFVPLLGPLPEGAVVSPRLRPPVDIFHAFALTRIELEKAVRQGLKEIDPAGMIWVSWPKKSSGVPSQVTGSTIRDVALPLGLVDVKVCAIDDTWSGLKLVIRKELRR